MKPVVRETFQVFIHAQFISVLSKVHLLPKNISIKGEQTWYGILKGIKLLIHSFFYHLFNIYLIHYSALSAVVPLISLQSFILI